MHIRDNQRYSIITNDLMHCIVCGRGDVNLHEIFGGRNRQNSKDYGLVIPLCQEYHHNQYKSIGIHFDKKLMDYWHIKGQEIAMQHYNWTEEEFRKIFYKSYIKGDNYGNEK